MRGTFFFFAVLSLALLFACAPPKHTLSSEEKAADLYWIYSQFGENYAPLDYKQQRYSIDYSALKRKYLKDSEATKTNEEFYELMYSFVSEFRDAHTSASLGIASLPGRVRVAYLGFDGKRKGDKLAVTELWPTLKQEWSNYPVKAGDLVAKIDGTPLKDVVLKDMARFRNLGQDESNLTYHMPRIVTRLSTANGLPKNDTARLTLVRDGKETEVTLPWVTKDYVTFLDEQRAARPKPAEATSAENDTLYAYDLMRHFGPSFVRLDPSLQPIVQRVLASLKLDPKALHWNWWETYRFLEDGFAFYPSAASPAELLAKERTVPAEALLLPEAKTYPVYVTAEKVLGADGKPTGAEKMVATMYLYTFSPGANEKSVVDEVKATLARLKMLKVNDLVIDMINNGGGSLSLGLKLAQALSSTKVEAPQIQYRLSETWMDEFEEGTLASAGSDTNRELDRRVLEGMREDQAKGKRLSRALSVETLMPFQLVPNDKLDKPLNVVLLVNEMCASMCDIFTAVLKDNGMARVVGARTMGAGGNVVEHMSAPNSHLSLRQTESLILRKDGSYIENNGVEPDVAMEVNETAQAKYEPVRRKAISLLVTEAAKPAAK